MVAGILTTKPSYTYIKAAFPEPLTAANLRFKPDIWSPDGELPLVLPQDVMDVLAKNYLVPELACAQLRRWARYGL